jgi:hypothetical protein
MRECARECLEGLVSRMRAREIESTAFVDFGEDDDGARDGFERFSRRRSPPRATVARCRVDVGAASARRRARGRAL